VIKQSVLRYTTSCNFLKIKTPIMSEHSQNYILWFKDISLDDRPRVGGKGGSLGELCNAKIPVPDGFVITTEGFTAYLDKLDAEHDIRSRVAALDSENMPVLNQACAELRDLVASANPPEEMVAAITSAYSSLGHNIPVAVRSSATSEDSEEASFAGLQDTYLWQKDADQVVDSIRKCWASLYNPESVSYRLKLGLPEDQLAMAVVVQTMVNSRCSGVMFTRSPTTGDRSVITLEASWGLGSSIVSGEVTPDKFVINKITSEFSGRDIANKTMEHIPDEKGGIIDQEVSEDRKNIPCISDEEVQALANVARQVEKHYGIPQDIEWAIDQDGDILLLQSRPETVWAARDRAPVAKPTDKAFGHIFNVLGGKK